MFEVPSVQREARGSSLVQEPGQQPDSAEQGGEQTEPPKEPTAKQKVSNIAIRVCQCLLLLTGMAWVFFFQNDNLDQTQVPGFLIALAISWWLTPEIRARAMKLKLVDKPGEERRIHKVPIPRLGGVAIYVSVMITIVLLIILTGKFPKDARGTEGLVGIAVGGTLIFVLGLVDDLESLRAGHKLVVQFLAAFVAYSCGVRIKAIPIPQNMNLDLGFLQIHGGVPIDLGPFAIVVTALWLVTVANAVNLIDGMDGLAAGVSAISCLTIWSVALGASIGRPYAALAAAVLGGALLGFLRWNFNPARIFLGDSGAYLTGFTLGAVSITGVIKGVAAATVIVPTFVLVFMILFFPLLDTTWAVVRRVARGRHPFSPDAAHIHHRLLNLFGHSQKKVAYLIYGMSWLFGLAATWLVGQWQYFLWLTGGVLVMALFFAEVLNRHRQRRGGPGPDAPSNQVFPNEVPPDSPPPSDPGPAVSV